MKRLIGIVVVLVLISSMLIGCAAPAQPTDPPAAPAETPDETDETPADENVTISFWTLSDRQADIQAVIDEFNAANPNITIETTYNSVDDHKRNLRVAASSRTLPDIWRNWGGSLASFFPEHGLSYDLTQYAADNAWADKFLPSALELATLEGQLAGRPFFIASMGIFFRRDIFETNGIGVPATFEELESSMQTLRDNGVIPISTAGANGWHIMRLVQAFIEKYAGPEVHDRLLVLEEDWTHPAVVQAFTKYKEWVDNGFFPEGFITANPGETNLLVFAGEAAMDIQGPWYETMILTTEGQDINNYGFFPMPLSAETNRMSAFIEMIQFNAEITESKLDAGMKFVDFMFSPETVFQNNFHQPMPYLENAFSEELVLVPQMIDAMNEFGTFSIADQALPQEIVAKLFEAQDNIALGVMTPEDAAQFIQDEIERYQAAQ